MRARRLALSQISASRLRSVGGQPRSRKGASEHVINWPKLLLAERWINRNKYYYELLNRLFRFLMGPKKGAEEKQYADHDLCSGKFVSA